MYGIEQLIMMAYSKFSRNIVPSMAATLHVLYTDGALSLGASTFPGHLARSSLGSN